MKAIGKFLWRFMVIFSFIVNIVLIVVLLVVGLLIFEIKNNIAEPLIGGLHRTAAGLGGATIDWTIPVRDTTIYADGTIPLNTNTTVILTEPVPLDVVANITLPGVGNLNNARVQLTLPSGLQLPVALALDVPLQDQALNVDLDVRAVIPLNQTQLNDPIQTLQLLFEPLALGLDNLPDDFAGAGDMATQILSGNMPDLLEGRDEFNAQAWPGYSLTAGYGYPLVGVPPPTDHLRLPTGIVPVGGIPLLDEQLRDDVWINGSPEEQNAAARQQLEAEGVPSYTYSGGFGSYYLQQQAAGSSRQTAPTPIDAGGTQPTPADPTQTTTDPSAPTPFGTIVVTPIPTPSGDVGIITPFPTPGG